MSQPHIFLLYHFFYPDDVVSARLFADLAMELASRGYAVTAMPSIRSCHRDSQAFRQSESWNGCLIRRVWRPDWKQSTTKGRVGNAFFVLLGWTWRALWAQRHQQETVIIGTDPILSVLVAIPWRLFRPNARIVHWCHDVYPHAAVSDGLLRADSRIARTLNRMLAVAYRRCDVIVDLGPCMRQLLVAAEQGCGVQFDSTSVGKPISSTGDRPQNRFITVTPWSLVEPERVVPADAKVREKLFGDCGLGLLYSGNLGRAHDFEPFLQLARSMRGDSAAFCFGGRGPRMDELKSAVSTEDLNIRFAGFAAEADLNARLAAADVHLVSLRKEWTGTVVPSKFFGALASGRPVLFAGSADAAIAKWIQEYQVGWLLTSENASEVAARLRTLSQSSEARAQLNAHCHRIYQEVFCKGRQVSKLADAAERLHTLRW